MLGVTYGDTQEKGFLSYLLTLMEPVGAPPPTAKDLRKLNPNYDGHWRDLGSRSLPSVETDLEEAPVSADLAVALCNSMIQKTRKPRRLAGWLAMPIL